jgi:uncharacterized protein (TIGR03084 family)
VKQICEDLAAEQDAVDAMVARLSEADWRRPTPAEGWDIADTIVHIVQADEAGLTAAADPDRFGQMRDTINARGSLAVFGDGAGRSGAEVLAWWRDTRAKMLAAFAALEPKDRIPWFGPAMSARSFATARLMETWSHGVDIAATLGLPPVETDRLKHVCHIGVTARTWSYVNRGLAVPDADVRVVLRAPSGAEWTWGPDDAADRVSGRALDFCLVATQRRPLDSTTLTYSGPTAEDWLRKAQAFAGPPTDTDANRAL